MNPDVAGGPLYPGLSWIHPHPIPEEAWTFFFFKSRLYLQDLRLQRLGWNNPGAASSSVPGHSELTAPQKPPRVCQGHIPARTQVS